uniref:Uncharacterized protein n=1 Tax=Anopheles darlingi TaxID=43151 RepID=A0A2M4D2M7_ANODA
MVLSTSAFVFAFSSASRCISIVDRVPSICCSCFSYRFFRFSAWIAARLFLVPFLRAVSISISIFFSRNSSFFVSIFSMSRSFCIASLGVGAGSPFLPENNFPKKLILDRV